ncbi:hypothetical protein [Streptomyces albovinaceus]|uniref:hypothetical protein n=1 Tax=Streptomyces albovinaceus subgroup TaxID=1482558 RepID=UPI003CC60599
MSCFTALGDAAIPVVVHIGVRAVVGVGPGDDAATVVVGERDGRPGGVEDLSQVSVLGVGVALDLLVATVRGGVGQGEGGDAVVLDGEGEAVAAGGGDGERGAVGGVLEGDPVAEGIVRQTSRDTTG